ncbi:transglycosylase SLT domain-containing protein [Paracoccus ravus]|uniref:transglycosylase SLT domain-containing protein n=1 Tax=Paracoccus ravus TaxID=2447760 RepID=UPI00106E0D42|nr:transglycosylase SLT domain-containing protein [Paracoccus ravus]
MAGRGLILAFLLAPSMAQAQDFSFARLFASPPPVVAETATGSPVAAPAILDRADQGICVAAIRTAEQRYAIPENLLMAIGLQEAGRAVGGRTTIWPWSVNSHGRTMIFDNRAEAIGFVRAEQAAGRDLIDIGCMQVNLRWHPEAFADLEAGFDPQKNADYAARFLRQLYAQSGDWLQAAGNYHSTTPVHHNRYLAGIRDKLHLAVAAADDLKGLAARARSAFGASTRPDGGTVSYARTHGFRRQTLDLPEQPFQPSRRAEPVKAPVAGPWWSADRSKAEAPRTIYSQEPIRSLLRAD